MGSPSRRMVIAGNWKMHKTVPEALVLVSELREKLEGEPKAELVLCPPFTALTSVAHATQGSPFKVGAQNCHWEPQGPFTGEVSASMVKDAGASYVILGHSERRQYFHETDETVNKRLVAALDAALRPIVCVGETLQDRDAGQTLTVVTRQLEGGLRGLTAQQAAHVVLAYEPVWAIGTGRNATSAQAQEVHAHIREELSRLFGRPVAQAMRIQYGGSVKPDNARELLSQPDVDGALVGGASLKAADFGAIIRAAG